MRAFLALVFCANFVFSVVSTFLTFCNFCAGSKMHYREMRDHFTKIISSCSPQEIDDLVSAIRSNKYWKVHSEKNDAIYVVALTQARIPFKEGFKAKSTASKTVVVGQKAARFCRRGRILVVKDQGKTFISNTVIEWPIFLRLIRKNQNHVYKSLIENPNPPPLLNSRTFRGVLKRMHMSIQLADHSNETG